MAGDEKLTWDRLAGKGLTIHQPRSGYRFSMDAVVLAKLADLNPADRVLDMGTGCGVVALILACRFSETSFYGVEIQKSLADIAAHNARENNLSHRITILHQNITALTPADTSGLVDAVVCNPPHIEKSRGRINPDPAAAIARHEIDITLSDIIAASFTMLKPKGRLQIIYPPARLAELMARMRDAGIEPKTMHLIYSRPDTPARRVLVKGIKGGRPGLDIPPPFIIYNTDGTYTKAARHMFGESIHSTAAGCETDFLFDTSG